jgi:hypothetical protein
MIQIRITPYDLVDCMELSVFVLIGVLYHNILDAIVANSDLSPFLRIICAPS